MIDLGIVLSQIAKEVWYWKVNNSFLLLKLLRKVVNKILLVQCNWRNGKCSQQECSIDSTYGLTCITCVTINDMYVSLDPHCHIFAAINKAGVFFLKVLIIYRYTEVFKSYTGNVIILSVNWKQNLMVYMQLGSTLLFLRLWLEYLILDPLKMCCVYYTW